MPGRSAPSLSVLRICSVFEPPRDLVLTRAAGFDPIGGMQNHTAELSRNLDRLGVRQTVVTTRPPGSPSRHPVGEHGEAIRLGWPIRRFRQLYSAPAVPVVLREGARCDLVHVHLGEDLAVIPLGLLAARRHGLPVVMTVHCSLRHTFTGTGARGLALRTLGAWLEGVGLRRTSAAIVLTRRLARAVAPDVPEDRIHIIPSGVNPELFAGPFEDPLPDVPHPRVVFLGRLVEQKGPMRLVRAAPLLPPEAHVVLVGDGPDRPELEAEIDRLGLRERVLITGFAHHHLVPGHLAHADVLVLPSTYEELGTVLLEGMYLGLPVVATNTGGVPEIVRDGRDGLLCDPSDPRALSAAITRILRDPALRARLSEGAREAGRRYDWPGHASRVLAIYRSVLAAPRPAVGLAGPR